MKETDQFVDKDKIIAASNSFRVSLFGLNAKEKYETFSLTIISFLMSEGFRDKKDVKKFLDILSKGILSKVEIYAGMADAINKKINTKEQEIK